MSECTALISLERNADDHVNDFAQRLAEGLAARGVPVWLIPDIYHMSPDDEALNVIRASDAPLIVFSGRFPRAAFWTLQALGITGTRSDTLSADRGRPIVCRHMAEKCCPDRWVEAVEELTGGFPGGSASVTEIELGPGERWYPVLDYSRCTDCGACLEFCLFGVYDRVNGRVIAADPGKCKPGCPACARVCPEQAIMFPCHTEDSVIAGSDTGTIQAFDPETMTRARQQFAAGDISIAEIVKACGCDPDPAEASAAENTGCGCECGEGNCCSDSSAEGDKAGCACGCDADCACHTDKDQEYFDQVIDRLEDK